MVISRRVYRFDSLPETRFICENNDVLRCAVSEFEGKYYMYIETKNEESEILKSINEENRLFEVFHFCPSEEADTWIKERSDPKAVISFIKLKPDKISSYIFYHYALQEEASGKRLKYYSIFISGALLINFHESPQVLYDPNVKGSLDSSISQRDDWNEYMKTHFLPGETWRRGEILLDYSI